MTETSEQSAAVDAGKAEVLAQPPKLQKETLHEMRRKKIELLCAVVGAFAAIAALYIAQSANQKSNESIRLAEIATRQAEASAQRAEFYTSLAARIDGCMAIASHHYYQIDRMNRLSIKEVIPEVEYNREPLPIASNSERAEAAVKMGRELTLCSSESPEFEAVISCVASATHDQDGKRVLDEIAPGKGRMNPAC